MMNPKEERIWEERRGYNQLCKELRKKFKKEPIVVENDGKNLSKFPAELLAKVFSLVGSKTFNPEPPKFANYIESKGRKDFQKKCNRASYDPRHHGPNFDHFDEKDAWAAKVKEEYPIRNLMLLRRVCTTFESVINNEMIPGRDFDFLMVDVRLQGTPVKPFGREDDKESAFEFPSRQVTFYKYGGNGCLNPAIRLNRLRRFNEMDYEHIQKFERIRDLHISDMVLTEELFETILRLDLTKARKITFERITDVKFDESINVVNYIQNFLQALNTSANVYFNSQLFDPNFVLFGLTEDEVEAVTDETALGEMNFITYNNDPFDTRSFHDKMKVYRRPEEEDFEFRHYKIMNLINTIIIKKSGAKKFKLQNWDCKSRSTFKAFRKKVIARLTHRLRKRSDGVKKAGEWHLKQVIQILDKKIGKDPKSAMFHLKILKQIVENRKMSAKEEESVVQSMHEAQHHNDSMENFQFMSKFQMKSRIYCPLSQNN